jgi:protein-arginine kinase activator protein McsA
MFRNRKNLNDLFKSFDDMFEQLSNKSGEWKSQTKMSEDGSFKFTTYYWSNDDKEQKTKIDTLQDQLNVAIENEDFETAVKLRDSIKNFETIQKDIDKLELELKESIKEQNFEKSIEIRDQLKKLK